MATFDYDALGRRIYAYDAIADAGRYFCYNNAWQVLEEYNTAGSFAWANVFGNYIDEVLVRSSTSSKYYYAHNHLYSPVAVMDFTAGTVLERYDYDAYGATHIMDASYTARTASAVGNPYSFTGRELDTLDGGYLKMMHYRYRSYDSFVGRFGQQDPLGVNPYGSTWDDNVLIQYFDGINTFRYVSDNPLSNFDPSGLRRRDPRSSSGISLNAILKAIGIGGISPTLSVTSQGPCYCNGQCATQVTSSGGIRLNLPIGNIDYSESTSRCGSCLLSKCNNISGSLNVTNSLLIAAGTPPSIVSRFGFLANVKVTIAYSNCVPGGGSGQICVSARFWVVGTARICVTLWGNSEGGEPSMTALQGLKKMESECR